MLRKEAPDWVKAIAIVVALNALFRFLIFPFLSNFTTINLSDDLVPLMVPIFFIGMIFAMGSGIAVLIASALSAVIFCAIIIWITTNLWNGKDWARQTTITLTILSTTISGTSVFFFYPMYPYPMHPILTSGSPEVLAIAFFILITIKLSILGILFFHKPTVAYFKQSQ